MWRSNRRIPTVGRRVQVGCGIWTHGEGRRGTEQEEEHAKKEKRNKREISHDAQPHAEHANGHGSTQDGADGLQSEGLAQPIRRALAYSAGLVCQQREALFIHLAERASGARTDIHSYTQARTHGHAGTRHWRAGLNHAKRRWGTAMKTSEPEVSFYPGELVSDRMLI